MICPKQARHHCHCPFTNAIAHAKLQRLQFYTWLSQKHAQHKKKQPSFISHCTVHIWLRIRETRFDFYFTTKQTIIPLRTNTLANNNQQHSHWWSRRGFSFMHRCFRKLLKGLQFYTWLFQRSTQATIDYKQQLNKQDTPQTLQFTYNKMFAMKSLLLIHHNMCFTFVYTQQI